MVSLVFAFFVQFSVALFLVLSPGSNDVGAYNSPCSAPVFTALVLTAEKTSNAGASSTVAGGHQGPRGLPGDAVPPLQVQGDVPWDGQEPLPDRGVRVGVEAGGGGLRATGATQGIQALLDLQGEGARRAPCVCRGGAGGRHQGHHAAHLRELRPQAWPSLCVLRRIPF